MLTVGARHRNQHLHRARGGDLARHDQALHRFGQDLHQVQAPGDPALGLPDPDGHIVEREVVNVHQFPNEQTLLQRREGRSSLAHANPQQGFAGRNVQDVNLHQVTGELPQGTDASVSIDHDVESWAVCRDDRDRELLTRLLQGDQERPFQLPVTEAQLVVGGLEKAELQLLDVADDHGSGRSPVDQTCGHGFQGGAAWLSSPGVSHELRPGTAQETLADVGRKLLQPTVRAQRGGLVSGRFAAHVPHRPANCRCWNQQVQVKNLDVTTGQSHQARGLEALQCWTDPIRGTLDPLGKRRRRVPADAVAVGHDAENQVQGHRHGRDRSQVALGQESSVDPPEPLAGSPHARQIHVHLGHLPKRSLHDERQHIRGGPDSSPRLSRTFSLASSEPAPGADSDPTNASVSASSRRPLLRRA